ncbi:conjugal transfer protein TraD [Erwinia psidii]|uniref:type IV secretion system DNA-binding domain-containing protein n=1 Tax=Erwinia psidii TaxID=69224 RepID=UPI00226B1818|nr:type IV secretion system DNA-binding domain-containing protein [Erwinia psidii]MCX8966583.1 conjugal transfer protein TraD [Erwinia psidii]
MQNKQADRSTMVDLNRGGQTLIHFLRMLHQTLKRYFRAVLCVYIVSSCFLGYYLTNTLDRYMGFKYYFCKLQYDFLNLKTSSANLTLPNGQTVVTTNQAIVESPLMQKHGEALYSNLLNGGLIAGVIALASAYILFRYLVKRGRKEARDEHVRGSELAEHDKLRDAAIMKVKETGLDSRIRIADIPLIRFQENSGIGLSGSPGTGKSNAMRDLLRQVRAMKKKAVVYDISGEFVKRFYRPGIDVILNCFDARSHSWDVWCEGNHEMVFDRQAKAAIPSTKGGDPFWTLSAQLFFSSLTHSFSLRSEKPEMAHLMHTILRMSADQISSVLADTDARNVINVDAEKLASSVRAIVTAYTRNLKYFAHTKGKRFSFKEWARDEDSDVTVFITVRDDMMEALRSPISMMLESAISAILSLEADEDRLIAVLIDELKTLNELPSLPNLINTGRKFGAMPVIGFQSPFQIYELMGESGGKAFFDSLGTFGAFRINGMDGAKWSAYQLGDREKEVANENTSFGANDVRDAVSVNHSQQEGQLLLASEIFALNDLHCYLKLNRGLPVSHIKYEHDGMKQIAPAILEADFLKNAESMKAFHIDNKDSPEAIIAEINKDAQSKNLKEIRSWEGQKKANEARASGAAATASASTYSASSESDSDSGEGISGGIDLMAMAFEREQGSASLPEAQIAEKSGERNISSELDIGF